MEYDAEGIPICENCGKNAEGCTCWDNDDVHEIISYRICQDLYESQHLDVRVDEEEDDEFTDDEPEGEQPEQ